MENEKYNWMQKIMPYYPNHKIIYWMLCAILFRRPTYADLFLFLYGMKKMLGKDEKIAQQIAVIDVMTIYAIINGKMPKGVEYDD